MRNAIKRRPPVVKIGVAGFHGGEALRLDSEGNEIPGSRRTVWPMQPNLILDSGLDWMGDNEFVEGCQVGSGNTAPAITDTALQTLVATNTSEVGDPVRTGGSSPYYRATRFIFRFGTGVAAGILAEIGITMPGTVDLLSRSLIKDAGGTPITIEILPDEVLDVTYEIRFYPPVADSVHTAVISGTTYDVVVRAADVTSNIGSGGTGGYQTGWGGAGALGYGFYDMGSGRGRSAYNGVLGAVTGSPTGDVSSAQGNITVDAYSSGSFTRTYTLNFGLTQGNLTGGISAIQYGIGPCSFQASFDPPIPKTASDVLGIAVRISWDRYAP